MLEKQEKAEKNEPALYLIYLPEHGNSRLIQALRKHLLAVGHRDAAVSVLALPKTYKGIAGTVKLSAP